MKRCVPLEPAAEAVCNQNSVPPLIFQMPPEQGRRVLEEAQNTPVYKYPVDIFSDCINILLRPRMKKSEILYSIFMVQAGYLAAFIHMKN